MSLPHSRPSLAATDVGATANRCPLCSHGHVLSPAAHVMPWVARDASASPLRRPEIWFCGRGRGLVSAALVPAVCIHGLRVAAHAHTPLNGHLIGWPDPIASLPRTWGVTMHAVLISERLVKPRRSWDGRRLRMLGRSRLVLSRPWHTPLPCRRRTQPIPPSHPGRRRTAMRWLRPICTSVSKRVALSRFWWLRQGVGGRRWAGWDLALAHGATAADATIESACGNGGERNGNQLGLCMRAPHV